MTYAELSAFNVFRNRYWRENGTEDGCDLAWQLHRARVETIVGVADAERIHRLAEALRVEAELAATK